MALFSSDGPCQWSSSPRWPLLALAKGRTAERAGLCVRKRPTKKWKGPVLNTPTFSLAMASARIPDELEVCAGGGRTGSVGSSVLVFATRARARVFQLNDADVGLTLRWTFWRLRHLFLVTPPFFSLSPRFRYSAYLNLAVARRVSWSRAPMENFEGTPLRTPSRFRTS